MTELVAVHTRWVYGTSGNELPPRVAGEMLFAYVQPADEDAEHFKTRMHTLMMAQRRKAAAVPARPYSSQDGWDLRFYPVREIPEVLP